MLPRSSPLVLAHLPSQQEAATQGTAVAQHNKAQLAEKDAQIESLGCELSSAEEAREEALDLCAAHAQRMSYEQELPELTLTLALHTMFEP